MADKKVVINGIEYSNLENAPEMVRQLFADKDGNQVPDLLEGKLGSINWMDLAKGAIAGGKSFATQNFVVKGKSYSNLMEIPEPERSEVMEKLKTLGKAWPAPETQAMGVPAGRSLPQDNMLWQAPRSSGMGKFILAAFATFIILVAAIVVVYFAVLPEK